MRIPHTIPRVCLRVHEGNQDDSVKKTPVDPTEIQAANPFWDEKIPKKLTDLAMQAVARYFQHMVKTKHWSRRLSKMTPEDMDHLAEILPLELPLSVAVTHVNHQYYWKRCATARWDVPMSVVNDNPSYANKWKRLYLERHVSEAVENFIPGQDREEDLLYVCRLCSGHVRQLNIGQLLPTSVRKSWGSDVSVVELREEVNDHLDLNGVLEHMNKLQEISVRFGAKSCGMDFSWKYFDVTREDMQCLSKALKNKRTLKNVRIRQSRLEDNHLAILAQGFLTLTQLSVLDLSHNKILDRGATICAKLATSLNNLHTIILCNNSVGSGGAKALAYSLTLRSVNLKVLNLRLNRIEDRGAQHLAKALIKNETLEEMNLSANRLGMATAKGMAEMLSINKHLLSLDLSGNTLTPEGGDLLAESLKVNQQLEYLDLRLTEVGQENEFLVNETLLKTREKHFKAEHAAKMAQQEAIRLQREEARKQWLLQIPLRMDEQKKALMKALKLAQKRREKKRLKKQGKATVKKKRKKMTLLQKRKYKAYKKARRKRQQRMKLKRILRMWEDEENAAVMRELKGYEEFFKK